MSETTNRTRTKACTPTGKTAELPAYQAVLIRKCAWRATLTPAQIRKAAWKIATTRTTDDLIAAGMVAPGNRDAFARTLDKTANRVGKNEFFPGTDLSEKMVPHGLTISSGNARRAAAILDDGIDGHFFAALDRLRIQYGVAA